MHKVKHQCKLCSKDVTAKTGLKCQGNCNSWAHYKCLRYSPEKINDIKAGYLKINCPCANCDISPYNNEEIVKEPHVSSGFNSNTNVNTNCCSISNQEYEKHNKTTTNYVKHGDMGTDFPKRVDKSYNTKSKYKHISQQLYGKNVHNKHSSGRKQTDKKVNNKHLSVPVCQESHYHKPKSKSKHYSESCSQYTIASLESDPYLSVPVSDPMSSSASSYSAGVGGNNEESDGVFESTMDGLCTTIDMFQRQFEELTGKMRAALEHI